MDVATALGELWGVGWLTYNPLRMRLYHQFAVRDAPGVMGALEREFADAHTYLDVGAGSGAFAAEAVRRGHPTLACEHSWFGRRLARRQGVVAIPFDLELEPPAATSEVVDLAYCFEVAEHVPPGLGDRLVSFLAAAAPTVVFTAAPPGQGGTGHVNEQPQGYWIERFERAGLDHDPVRSDRVSAALVQEGVQDEWLVKNVMVFAAPGSRPAARGVRSSTRIER
jgi:SAM-dependent methyltransferase